VDAFLLGDLAPFILEGVLLVIGVNEMWGMDLVSWFPGVVHFRIPYPFDEILEGSRPAGAPVVDDLFDLVFFFSFDKVRRWSQIVGSMCGCFTIG